MTRIIAARWGCWPINSGSRCRRRPPLRCGPGKGCGRNAGLPTRDKSCERHSSGCVQDVEAWRATKTQKSKIIPVVSESPCGIHLTGGVEDEDGGDGVEGLGRELNVQA